MPFLAAAIPAAIAGGASAAGSAIVGGVLGGGPGRGTQFQANPGVTANDVTGKMNDTEQVLRQQQAFTDALAAQGGIQNQSNVYNQYSDVASGKGPNPAQAMLANSTGQNIAAQSALMAGQRGSSANAGLISRQAAMQGGNLQQQAVGQGAALQAQQSLGALGAMGNIAGQQVAQQQGAQSALMQGQLNEQQLRSNALGAANGQNQAAQAQIAKGQIDAAGGLAQGVGTLGTALGGQLDKALTPTSTSNADKWHSWATSKEAHGGMIGYAEGGEVAGPRSRVGRHLKGLPMLAHDGKVPALVSPGEVYLNPREVKHVAKDHKNPIKAGQKIPGKAQVRGDSEKNDTVKRSLDKGGIVIPRSIVMDKEDPAGKAAKFVEAIFAKSGRAVAGKR